MEVAVKPRRRTETYRGLGSAYLEEETVNCPQCKDELYLGETEPTLCPHCGFDLEEFEDSVLLKWMEDDMNDPDNAESVSEDEIMKILRR